VSTLASRTATDTAGSTDTVAVTRGPVVDDPAGPTDTANRVATYLRAADDTAGLTDTVTAAVVVSVTVTDPAGLTDERTLTFLAAVTDTTGLADAVSVATATGALFARTVTDLVGLADDTTGAARAVRNITLTAVTLPPRYPAAGVPPRYTTTALPKRWISMAVITTTRRMALGSTELQGISFTGPPGLDLSGDPVTVAVQEASVQSPANTIWLTPTLLEATAARITAWLLIGPQGGLDVGLGRWRLWARLVDSPEVPWIPAADVFTVV
jgi:hypothetical protein